MIQTVVVCDICDSILETGDCAVSFHGPSMWKVGEVWEEGENYKHICMECIRRTFTIAHNEGWLDDWGLSGV